MTTENFLSRLEGVKRTGEGRYLAKCPAHEDHSPSLSIRELPDGRMLVHCFSGCDVGSILAAVSLGMDALFPERLPEHHYVPERRPFPALDVLKAVVFETTVVCLVASDLLQGKSITEESYGRLRLAADRLDEALALAGGTP